MTGGALAELPGFRRRFRVTASQGQVTAALEDDYHCMAVTLRHDGETITAVEAVMDRAPWTTCPGSPAVLKSTFEGVALSATAARGEKKANCTHLHDLAVLAAAHAQDQQPAVYDILVSDAVDGQNVAEIVCNGDVLLRLVHEADIVVEPEAVRGVSLFKLRPWIESLDAPLREAARLLQWGTIIAHGRAIPMERQSDASRIPPNCYTFQPERAVQAKRIGKIIDFSNGPRLPLDHFDGTSFRTASTATVDAQ